MNQVAGNLSVPHSSHLGRGNHHRFMQQQQQLNPTHTNSNQSNHGHTNSNGNSDNNTQHNTSTSTYQTNPPSADKNKFQQTFPKDNFTSGGTGMNQQEIQQQPSKM